MYITYLPVILLAPPEECGEWLKLPELEGEAGLLGKEGNLTVLGGLLTEV